MLFFIIENYRRSEHENIYNVTGKEIFVRCKCICFYCMPLLQIKNFFVIINITVHEVFQFGWSISQRIVKMWYT